MRLLHIVKVLFVGRSVVLAFQVFSQVCRVTDGSIYTVRYLPLTTVTKGVREVG